MMSLARTDFKNRFFAALHSALLLPQKKDDCGNVIGKRTGTIPGVVFDAQWRGGFRMRVIVYECRSHDTAVTATTSRRYT